MRVNNDMQMNSFGIDTLTIQLADFTLADRPDLNVEQARVELSTGDLVNEFALGYTVSGQPVYGREA